MDAAFIPKPAVSWLVRDIPRKCGRTRNGPRMANKDIAAADNVVDARRRMNRELELIAEWESKARLGTKDPWAAFLRGTVFTCADYVKEADQFFLKSQKCGFNQGPEPHYRRAAVLFRLGQVREARKEWDEGLRQATEMVGNLLHFGYKFQQEYSQFLPVWYGPERPVQQAACYYCCGTYDEAERILVGITVLRASSPLGYLWAVASIARLKRSRLEKLSLTVPDSKSEAEAELLRLYSERDETIAESIAKTLEDLIPESSMEDKMDIQLYLALYYDSLRPDAEKRDMFLGQVLQGDREAREFNWYVARNGLGKSPDESQVLPSPDYELMRSVSPFL